MKASEPKVQLPFYTKPGDCPRKIEIERWVINTACEIFLKAIIQGRLSIYECFIGI